MTNTSRGRKSAASLTVVRVESLHKPPAVPGELAPGAATLWTQIIKSVPAEFFSPGDLPLLESYCVSFDRKRRIDAQILEHGLMYDGEVHPGLRISRDEASLMASLAVKLRLCQSSRTRPDASILNKVGTGKRPWEPIDDKD